MNPTRKVQIPIQIPILLLALILLSGCGTVQRYLLKTFDNTYHRKAAQLVIVQLDDARVEAVAAAVAKDAAAFSAADAKFQAATAKMSRPGGCDATCQLEVRVAESEVRVAELEIAKNREAVTAHNAAFSDVHSKLGLISGTWTEEPPEVAIRLFDKTLVDAKAALTELLIRGGTVESEKARKALRARL